MRRMGWFVVAVLAGVMAFAQEKTPDEEKPEAAPVKEEKKEAEKEKPKVSMRLVRLVVTKSAEGEDGRALLMGGFRAGTMLSFSAVTPVGRVIGVDSQASRVDRLTDDRGTDLAAGEDGINAATISEDHFAFYRGGCVFHVSAPGVPAEGAGAILLVGEVTLVHSGKTATAVRKDVEPKPGSKIDLGLAEMTIVDIPNRWASWQNAKGFGLQWKDPDRLTQRRLISIELEREDGTPFGNVPTGSSQDANQTMTRYFNLGEDLKKVTIRITYHDDIRNVRVPLDLATGVGF